MLSRPSVLSVRLTAAVVKTLAAVDQVNKVDRQALSESVAWLIRHAQQQDGSFKDKSSFIHNKFMASAFPLVLLSFISLL